MAQQFIDVRWPALKSGAPNERKTQLVRFLLEKLQACIAGRSGQVEEKMLRWQNNYMGKPRQSIRTTPFYNASNFVSGMIRMHTDIYHARIMGFIFGVKPFWQPQYFSSTIKHEWLDSLADWMDYTCWNRMNFFEPIDAGFHDVCKLGTVVMKAPWVERELWKATAQQEGQSGNEKQVFSRIDLSPIHYQDFMVYPFTARTLETVQICFHRLKFTEMEVRWRQANRGWDKKASDMVLQSPANVQGAADLSSAIRSGIQLTPDTTRPYQVVECHLDYDLYGDGKLYSIVALLNPLINSEDAILRMYYNPAKEQDLNPFIDFHLTPKGNEFWKDGIPAILEGHFEEHTQLHCDRRDSSTIANIPTFKKKRFAEVGRPAEEWYPGKVFELDNMQDLDVMNLAASYNHMIEEEHEIMAQAERLVGNPPPTQGMGSGSMGKRGTYNTGGTIALLAEGNRRLDLMVMRLRSPMHKVGRLIYTSHRDYGDEATFYQQVTGKDTNDANLKAALSLQPPAGFGPLWFGLNASNASANRETERTSLLLMANTLGAYYKELFQLMQMVVGSPEGSPAKELGLQVLDGARDLAGRILRAFNVPDNKKLLPDLRAVLGGQGLADGSQPPGAERLPPAEGNVQPRDVSTLSATIAQIAKAGGRGNVSGGPVGGVQ